MTNIFGVRRCPLCGGTEFIYNRDTGEVVCKNCGYVIKVVNIDMGPEWRNFEDDKVDRSRAGPPLTPLLKDRGMATVFGNVSEDKLYGGRISDKRRREIWRVKKWVRRMSDVDGEERNLKKALNILELFGGRLNIHKHVLGRAAEIYRIALERKLMKGRMIKMLVAASLYIALREFQTPYSFRHMAEDLNIESKKLGVYYRFLVRKLGIKVPRADPSLYIRQIVSKASLPSEVIACAEKIINYAERRRITLGKDPVGLASVSVYYAALLNGYEIKYRELAKVSGVSEITVRNISKYFMKSLGFKELDELRIMLRRLQKICV